MRGYHVPSWQLDCRPHVAGPPIRPDPFGAYRASGSHMDMPHRGSPGQHNFHGISGAGRMAPIHGHHSDKRPHLEWAPHVGRGMEHVGRGGGRGR